MLGEMGVEAAAGQCLYQVVVQGARFSATCSDGHRMVMELLERFHLLDTPHGDHEAAPPAAHARVAELLSVDPIGGVSREARAPSAASEAPAAAAPIPPAAAGPVPNTVPASSEPTLFSDFRALHLTNLARNRKHPKASGYLERVYALKFVEDLLGDKPIDQITVDDANVVADALAVWPAYLHNLPDYKDVPARKVVAKARHERPPALRKATQRKHVLSINAFFNWCVELKAIESNPFRVIQLTRYREAVPENKNPFSPQDLKALFHPDRQRLHNAPHKTWIPLVALLSGMRVNEISQLHVADIKCEEVMDDQDNVHTIHYFDVTPFRKGQSLKTAYSHRRVPIHSKLIDAGFLRYVDDVRDSGALHLFPGLPWKEGGPGRAITRWFNRNFLRKECGITDRTKTFHCFRHTLTTLAERCGIPKSVRTTINGHSNGAGIEEKRYIARGSLLECKQALEKLRYPEFDILPYVPGQYADYLASADMPKVLPRKKASRPKS
ncbi:site-specific integrase [Luteibacter sp. 1214]|uniref:site-specific integrase n=1 Tax=Luteibacter sp. 1214 TaxID=2817735 RepID=UPI00286CB0B6|nr:site-specific integrase [Luteibacter sp. 1214]